MKTWFLYLHSVSGAKPTTKYTLYERALKFLPRSYKLWWSYLNAISSRLDGKQVSDKRYLGLQSVFERSLVYMNKMPQIW